MRTKSRILIYCVATFTLVAPTASPQNMRPMKMQSPEQQKQDDAQCAAWAGQQTGYDPAKPWFTPQASSPLPAAGSSPPVRSGEARGISRRDAGDAAVAGAIVGFSPRPEAGTAAAAIVGRDGLNIAPGGAVAGATVQPGQVRRPNSEQEQATAQQPQAGSEYFQKARIACLEARGYAMR
jgi:hypothetical protein